MAKKTDKTIKKEAREEFRRKYYSEVMEKNKEVLISIRDSNSNDKNKVEACKLLARMVGGLQPEKMQATQSEKKPQETPSKLSQKDLDEIEKLVQAE